MQETTEHRVLTIAVRRLQEKGLCWAFENDACCTKLHPTDEDCRNCIKNWLMWQARWELKQEQSKKKK